MQYTQLRGVWQWFGVDCQYSQVLLSLAVANQASSLEFKGRNRGRNLAPYDRATGNKLNEMIMTGNASVARAR